MGKLKKKQSGISLLEILVVLILVSVLIGTVRLSINAGSGNRLSKSVDDLKNEIQATRENAILQGRLYAVVFSRNNYTIYVLNNDNKLVEAEKDSGLHSGHLPDGSTFGELSFGDTIETGKTRLIIDPSNPLPTFRLAITNHKQTWWLSNRPEEGLRVTEQAT